MTPPESILAKLRKIKALADQGATEGERGAATAALHRLLALHGLDPEAIADTVTHTTWFTFRSATEKKILLQVLAMITESRLKTLQFWDKKKGGRRVARTIGVDLTAIQAADAIAAYAHYRKEWTDHLAIQFDAFIQRHRLFAPSTAEEPVETDPAYLQRLIRAMRGVTGQTWERPGGHLGGGPLHLTTTTTNQPE